MIFVSIEFFDLINLMKYYILVRINLKVAQNCEVRSILVRLCYKKEIEHQIPKMQSSCKIFL